MRSKENTQLSYINIRIIQYPYGISIYQPAHIHYTILVKWFTYASDKVNSYPNTLKEDSTFEMTLSENLPSTPAELHLLEECYLGKFSTYIGKILHIMQYTHPYLMYAVIRL